VYAILTQEGAVAVIDTSSWQVTQRIDLGTNPNGIFLRAGS
jgi:YVTN family beta-propeller protein